jgi:rfaE bifunctional protein nucleotidyltransferase chain/domain
MQQNPENLLMSLEEAIKWRDAFRKNAKKLVVTNGCFDILHRGHAEYLYQARQQGDALLILLNSDDSIRSLKGPARPVLQEKDRAYMLASLKAVDGVVIFGTPRCTDLFMKLLPDVYIKGGDYNIDTINEEEKNALIKVGAEIKFIPFVKGFSTTGILQKI